jgi:sodium-dependent phosphate cotransporter
VAGYLSIACGLGITLCVQSSSITTSAITPLVGVGVIKLERMYPVVLGANIGTCLTGVLAALAADGSKLALTLQVAYCHLFFNLSGIVLFYVIWPLRGLPINAARFLGNTTADYKWFAPFYLFMCFFLIPLIFFGISLGSTVACVVIGIICFLVFLFVVTVNTLQTRKPDVLPGLLKDWSFLPKPMRSLEPMDRILCEPLNRVICTPLGKICCRCCPSGTADVELAKAPASSSTTASSSAAV